MSFAKKNKNHAANSYTILKLHVEAEHGKKHYDVL